MSIIPLRQTLVRRVLQVVAAVALVWLGVFLGLNDRRLGKLVTKVVATQIRGEFRLGYARYSYFSSLASIILNTTTHVEGGDFEMRDPNGELVMKASRIEADIYLGELIRGLLRTAVSSPFGRGSFVELHFASGHLHSGWAHVRPIQVRRLYPPNVTGPQYGNEVNIVATMSGKKPKPEGAPPSPGHLRITIDGEGLTFGNVSYEMSFPGWHGQVNGLKGAVTLRFSSDAAETRPGLQSFVYEVAPMTADGGELVLGTKEGSGEFVFPLKNLELRRFGARAGRKQDLVFRGKVQAADADVEVDGKLLDTYCDTGIQLDLSFTSGHGLAKLVPGGLLSGQPRGRVRFYGALSSTLPTTVSGRLSPCLSQDFHVQNFPTTGDGRAIVIEGQVADIDALVASIAISGARSRFTLKGSELHMPKVTGNALGGQIRVEPLHFSFAGDLPWSARIAVQGTDPAQVGIMPKILQPLVAGRLKGTMRLSGSLAKNAHPERVVIDRVDALVERVARHDPLPKEMKLLGSFVYTPDNVLYRGLALSGDTLTLRSDHGAVSPRDGKLDIPVMELAGRGSPLGRVLQYFGVSGQAGEAQTKFRLGGRIIRPEASRGEFTVKDLDLFGRKLDEITTDFALHDGKLNLSLLHARGRDGSISGDASIQLFTKDVSQRPDDPLLSVKAAVSGVSVGLLLPGQDVSGVISGNIDVTGSMLRPIGEVDLRVPKLTVLGGQFDSVAVLAQLSQTQAILRSLSAQLDTGKLSSMATLRHEKGRPLELSVELAKLPIGKLPIVQGLPLMVDGTLSGALKMIGSTQPLLPVFDGKLSVDGFTVQGRLPTALGPAVEGGVVLAEREPLFGLLGMVVRVLTLGQAELRFTPVGAGTKITGRLFESFEVDGVLTLAGGLPRGDLTIRFGCPLPPYFAKSADGPTSVRVSSTVLVCDLLAQKLLPDLAQLGDVSASGSGELRLRFGDDPRPLFGPDPQFARGITCPVLASRPLAVDESRLFGATLRLNRALLSVRTITDEGEDQRYLAFNDGDVFSCFDGRDLELGQARFISQRRGGERSTMEPKTLVATGRAGESTSEGGAIQFSGVLSPVASDLRVRGQLRLELLEHLLRSVFRRTQGEATVDVRISGPIQSLQPLGSIELRNAQVEPHELETPIEVHGGKLLLRPQRAELENVRIVVDSAVTLVRGSVEVERYTPLALGRIAFELRGDISARLLQWQFARNLAEARGRFGLDLLKITGTFVQPIVEGTLTAHEVFLNLRRFHELSFSRGTIRFVRVGSGDDGRIIIGRGEGSPGGVTLAGLVDGDGKIELSGRVDHSGMGGFIQSAWHRALDRVDLAIKMENVRHSSSGVYNVEMSSARGLTLTGSRDGVSLLGDIEVVAGRYMQDYDPTDRFLSARRIVEEDKPFWDGDDFLSQIKLGVAVRTRGTFRVFNNIADLRLSTQAFDVAGPLVDIAMNGVIRVESGVFYVPGLRGEFHVKGDSKIVFSKTARWPDTPYVDVLGGTRDFDQNDQQRNVEVALRGRVRELKFECLSSDGLSAADCASFLLLGDAADAVRGGRPNPTSSSSGSPRAIDYGDPAAKLVTSQLLTNQVADPLREKLRLDTVRIQFGVSTFDLQLCKRFGLYIRMCGLAEWGLLGNAAARYRGYGELQMSDLTVGQISLERIERGFSFLEDTINRFKVQAGLRLPLRY
jgi:hypothetical protein